MGIPNPKPTPAHPIWLSFSQWFIETYSYVGKICGLVLLVASVPSMWLAWSMGTTKPVLVVSLCAALALFALVAAPAILERARFALVRARPGAGRRAGALLLLALPSSIAVGLVGGTVVELLVFEYVAHLRGLQSGLATFLGPCVAAVSSVVAVPVAAVAAGLFRPRLAHALWTRAYALADFGSADRADTLGDSAGSGHGLSNEIARQSGRDDAGARRTFRAIRWFLVWYGAFTVLLSVLSFVSAVVRSSDNGFVLLLFGGLGLYGLTCGAGMLFAWDRTRRRLPTATRWTRLATALSLPGSAFVGLASGIGLADFVNAGPAVDDPGTFAIGCLLLTIFLATIGNVVVLLRLLFGGDLDDLLWSDVESDLEVGLNFDEST